MHQKIKIIRSDNLDDLENETNIFISERAGHIYAVKYPGWTEVEGYPGHIEKFKLTNIDIEIGGEIKIVYKYFNPRVAVDISAGEGDCFATYKEAKVVLALAVGLTAEQSDKIGLIKTSYDD